MVKVLPHLLLTFSSSLCIYSLLFLTGCPTTPKYSSAYSKDKNTPIHYHHTPFPISKLALITTLLSNSKTPFNVYLFNRSGPATTQGLIRHLTAMSHQTCSISSAIPHKLLSVMLQTQASLCHPKTNPGSCLFLQLSASSLSTRPVFLLQLAIFCRFSQFLCLLLNSLHSGICIYVPLKLLP